MANQAKLLFSEVLNALSHIVGALNNGIKTLESRHQTDELEVLLQKEKSEFEVRPLSEANFFCLSNKFHAIQSLWMTIEYTTKITEYS